MHPVDVFSPTKNSLASRRASGLQNWYKKPAPHPIFGPPRIGNSPTRSYERKNRGIVYNGIATVTDVKPMMEMTKYDITTSLVYNVKL